MWGETLNTNCHHQHGVVPGSMASRGQPRGPCPAGSLLTPAEMARGWAASCLHAWRQARRSGPLTLSLHVGPPGCSPSLAALFPPASSLTWFSALCRLPLPLGRSLPGRLSAFCLSRSWLLHPLPQGPNLGPSFCFHVCFSLSPLTPCVHICLSVHLPHG